MEIFFIMIVKSQNILTHNIDIKWYNMVNTISSFFWKSTITKKLFVGTKIQQFIYGDDKHSKVWKGNGKNEVMNFVHHKHKEKKRIWHPLNFQCFLISHSFLCVSVCLNTQSSLYLYVFYFLYRRRKLIFSKVYLDFCV